MKTLGYALSILTAVLLAGSLLGGLAGAVWLLVLGEWQGVLLGGAMAVAVLLLAPLALLPARLLAGAAGGGMSQGGLTLVALATNAYTGLIMTAGLLAFLWLLFHDTQPGHPLPAALWSYAAATLPWLWLAYSQDRSTEGGGGGAALLAILGKAAYVAGALSSYYGGLGALQVGTVMALVVGLGVVLNTSGARRSAPG